MTSLDGQVALVTGGGRAIPVTGDLTGVVLDVAGGAVLV
jgi:hypothetical protein